MLGHGGWGMGAMAQRVCVVLRATEHEQLAAIARRADAPCARLGGAALGG